LLLVQVRQTFESRQEARFARQVEHAELTVALHQEAQRAAIE